MEKLEKTRRTRKKHKNKKKQKNRRSKRKDQEENANRPAKLYFNGDTDFVQNADKLWNCLNDRSNKQEISMTRCNYKSVNNFITMDVKLKRNFEDKLYFKEQWFMKNIRRGLTLGRKMANSYDERGMSFLKIRQSNVGFEKSQTLLKTVCFIPQNLLKTEVEIISNGTLYP